ncbi:tagaturonate reductase [Brevibacillus brevis]|uniref:Tagaturonate reductase n=1 Tax=Brevibacillus brevis TaxID=1393 RepID=A0ABY9T755_BREBE|nr:tagaturonate reductase [Brevibacillus brevis]WNC15937.1 tagaturonate reductase [Brevibacillus brevis]
MNHNQAPQLNGKWLDSAAGDPGAGGFPERVLQIGEGNFMRGFIDWMLQRMNQSGHFQGRAVAIQPTPRGKVVPKLNRQDGLYTLVQRGVENGEPAERVELISAISRGINPYENWAEVLKAAESREIRFVFSNTTEAGLQWSEEDYEPEKSPLSYPGKLVALLYHRFLHFGGAEEAGWIILPCELVEDNGAVLKGLCEQVAAHWGLPDSFLAWMEEACAFCNTLVDRIVTGFPHGEEESWAERLGYRDELLAVCEPYHLFVIEGPEGLADELPLQKAGLNVYFDRIDSYRERKVRLLNGPHTLLASVAFLAGVDTVREAVEDPQLRAYLLHAMTEEIKESLQAENRERADRYIRDVLERFANPYLQHRLLDISLNGLSKCKARLLPSLAAYQKEKEALPQALVFGLAALLVFYRGTRFEGERYFGTRQGQGEYEIRDQAKWTAALFESWQQADGPSADLSGIAKGFLGMTEIWGEDLNRIPGLGESVTRYAEGIMQGGVRQTLREIGFS